MRAGKHSAKMLKEAALKAQAELDKNPPTPDDPDVSLTPTDPPGRWVIETKAGNRSRHAVRLTSHFLFQH